MSEKQVHIAVLMMVKNEHKRLHVSLESIKNVANSLVLYDTGSTDDTIEIAQNFCQKHNILLRLKQGEFIDFSTSRNVSLDFADTFDDIDFIVLLDTNDELRGGDHLRKFCKEHKDKPNTGYLVCQEWWSGNYDKYYNVRMVKARQGWRYRGRVHEWMKNTRFINDKEAHEAGDYVMRVPCDIILYQDRTQDDDKSGKRFARDKVLLLSDHKDDPTEPRTVFYLAQTCACLNHLDDAFYFYKLRTTLEGFWEERFHAFFRCGELSQRLQHPWHESMKWYMQAFEHTARVEPLIKIIEYYKDKNWLLCYTFADLACKLAYPDHCILFVDKHSYDYTRWHLLGISGWYAGFHKEGKIGCQKAIACGLNVELDTNNLKHYEEEERREAEEAIKNSTRHPQLTKKQFIDMTCQELAKEHPNLNMKQLLSKAKRLWKARN
jgi:glycosyltransferase involved in cell wall biosynthesis